MTDLASLLTECIPTDWVLSHIINLNKLGWQVNLKDDEHVACGTGQTIEEALQNAATKIANEQFVGSFRLRDMIYNEPKIDLSVLISGLRKPMEDRRF